MALPKLNYPTFELTLPSTKETIKLRPFLVKEEKILLIAQQTEDPYEVVNAIKQVINNCIITADFDINKLTTFDLEYVFLKLRARSVNNVITLTYRDTEDEKSYTVEVDLDEVQVVYNADHKPLIEMKDGMILKMKYPTANLTQSLNPELSESEIFFELMKHCIEGVVQGSEFFSVEGSTAEEIDEFISSLDVNTFQKVQEFFQTMPRVKHEVSYTNSNGNKRTIVLDNLNDFFTLG